MSRSVEERIAGVRRLLRAADEVYRGRARIAGAIAATTGLTPAGVELGFGFLERDATDADLAALVHAAGDADRVHVVLSANVFVAALRALAIARAASARVSVRPSPRDPTLARALVEAAADPGLSVTHDRDLSVIDRGEIHVYGRDDTIAAARARARPGVIVRGHGAGLGVAIVTRAADVSLAAEALAADVVPFDQRGCLSPRLVVVEGDAARGEQIVSMLTNRLEAWARDVPRGALSDDEHAQAACWRDALAFAGRVWDGTQYAVALAPSGAPLQVPPPGRHVHVAVEPSLEMAAARLAPIARFIVAVGTDDAERVRAIAPPSARVGALGRMQRPPFTGPVDLRSF